MKIKLGERSFTVMIIPGANHKVLRFRFSALMLYMMPIIGLTVLCLTLSIHIIGMQNKLAKEAVVIELAEKTFHYEQSLSEREEMIEELQNNLVYLSQQTEEMKLKVAELKELEEEIRDISNKSVVSLDNRPVSIASFSNHAADGDLLGMGGANIEASSEDIQLLIWDTQLALSGLDGEVSSLLNQLSDAKEHIIEQIHLQRITPSVWPTVATSISSRFGYRKDPFTRKSAFHAGIDISGNSGDPVYAAADGVVTNASYDSAYGYNIIIKHASGVSTRYGHLKKLLVKKGQLIEQGETIGLLGSTGRSTGPHLHYEILKNGQTIDPMPYLLSSRKGEE